jgi:peptide-methionine (S)-S-oxide reductase
MRSTLLLSALLIPLTLASARAATTPEPKFGKPAPPAPAGYQKATFAGGCFWSMESAFEGLPGVTSVISGYTGGNARNPTYEQVSAKLTGHAEAVQITFDPRQISYAQLLEIFWHNSDPTDASGQFCDRGSEYRSEVFYLDTTQKRLADQSKRGIENSPHRFKQSIVTKIVAAGDFWPAEDYHQQFARKNPARYHEYRVGCGRDERLIELWGKPGRQGEPN